MGSCREQATIPMSIDDIIHKLTHLQRRMVEQRHREDMRPMYEDMFWYEINRLRTMGHYDRLPHYVGWLTNYHHPITEYEGTD